MIRIHVGAPAKTGLFPYRIDGHWGPGGAPLIGIADNPVAEACRVLQALGVELGTRISVEAPHTRLSGLLGNFLKKVANVLPPPQKALPAPRRARRRVLQVRGAGIPGDGI